MAAQRLDDHPHWAPVFRILDRFVPEELLRTRGEELTRARLVVGASGVASFLILSLGAGALLNLCGQAEDGAPPAGDAPSQSDVCTGYVEAGTAHPKLLRSPRPSAAFKVDRLHKQVASKAAIVPIAPRRKKN